MPAKVADTSVIGAMAFQEPRRDEAMSLLRGADLYEPRLLHFELASIARKKALRYPDLVEFIERGLQRALAIKVHWIEVNQLSVLRLALETGLTTYDASYLHVARVMAAPLVTFDEKLERASKGLP